MTALSLNFIFLFFNQFPVFLFVLALKIKSNVNYKINLCEKQSWD